MNSDQIKAKKKEITNQFGDWHGHNFYLKNDIFTYDADRPDFSQLLTNYEIHIQRMFQIVADLVKKPFNTLRILDLASLEGLYGIEFARQGAEVVGIEGRESNIKRSQFAKEVLDLKNITFIQDDVRNLSLAEYGHFDVVLCFGILYHINSPDVFKFVESIFEVCQEIAIFDTHIGIIGSETHNYKGKEYHGWSFKEHSSKSSQEERLKASWASLDNPQSFWLTRPSLYNLLVDTGFTSIYDCKIPAVPSQWEDRDTIVAVKGSRVEINTNPVIKAISNERVPEKSEVGYYPVQQTYVDEIQLGILEKTLRYAKRIPPGILRRLRK